MSDLSHKIRDSVAEGRLPDALNELEKWAEQATVPKELTDELVTCRMRLFNLENNKRRGTVSQENYAADLVQIAQQIIELSRQFVVSLSRSTHDDQREDLGLLPDWGPNARQLIDVMERELTAGFVRNVGFIERNQSAPSSDLTPESARNRLATATSHLFSVHQADCGGIRSGSTHWIERDEAGEWTTAEAVYVALRSHQECNSGPHPKAIGKAIAWLVGGPRRAKVSTDGGWGDVGFESRPPYRPKFPPCSESTAWAVMALSEALKLYKIVGIELDVEKVEKARDSGVKWLQKIQRPEGGWASFKNDELGPRTYPTAIVLVGLSHVISGNLSEERRGELFKVIHSGVAWLARTSSNGEWKSNLQEPSTNASITALVFYALHKLIRAGLSPADSAIALVSKEREFTQRASRSPDILKNHVESMPWVHLGAVLQLEWMWLPWGFASIVRSRDDRLLKYAMAELCSNYLDQLDSHRSWTICLAAVALCAYLEEVRLIACKQTTDFPTSDAGLSL